MPDAPWLGVPSPSLAGGSPLYVTGEDGLRLTVLNSAAGVTVTLSGRFLPARQRSDESEPRVGAINQVLVPATNRTASTVFAPLGEGWLLDWSVQVTAGTPLKGNTYAILELMRGTTGTLSRLSRLGEGYITATVSIGWPGSAFQGMLDGAGAIRSIAAAVPAAGAEVSETCPTGARWELLDLIALFTTSAAVANRMPSLIIDDGANVVYRIGVAVAQTATQANRYAFASGTGATPLDQSNIAVRPIPTAMPMLAGWRLRTLTTAIDVADTWTLIFYVVREWLEA